MDICCRCCRLVVKKGKYHFDATATRGHAYSEGRKLAAGFVAVATELHQLLDDPSLHQVLYISNGRKKCCKHLQPKFR